MGIVSADDRDFDPEHPPLEADEFVELECRCWVAGCRDPESDDYPVTVVMVPLVAGVAEIPDDVPCENPHGVYPHRIPIGEIEAELARVTG